MVTALILSGGMGTRLGEDIPKQYIKFNGKMIIEHCIRMLSASNRIDGVWIVAADEWVDAIMKIPSGKIKGFSNPGRTRQLSIYNGICDIRKNIPDTDYVFIHDAARPMITEEDIELVIDAALKCDGAMPVLPMKDTVYLSENGGFVTGLLDRSQVYAGQAPEVFMLDKYIEANDRLIVKHGTEISDASPIFRINGSSEPAVMAGMNIALVKGNENNFKITTRADLERFKEIINR